MNSKPIHLAPLRKIAWRSDGKNDIGSQTDREWLVTNGLGGYASGTLAGPLTRRYHGLLVAALGAPLGRLAMLSHFGEQLHFENGIYAHIGAQEPVTGDFVAHGAAYLSEFRLEQGLPVWQYRIEDTLIEKCVLMPHQQNTVYITYSVFEGEEPFSLSLRPLLQFRRHDDPVESSPPKHYLMSIDGKRYEFLAEEYLPPLKMTVKGEKHRFVLDGGVTHETFHSIEAERGYEASRKLWSPGYFSFAMRKGSHLTIIASVESWDAIEALSPNEALSAEQQRRSRLIDTALPEARSGLAAELVIAADQFIITPAGRTVDAVRTHASGDEVRSVIAGYHWFTDWGRDTMISLEGLALITGRHAEAAWILKTFGRHISSGLIPNLFPEGCNEGKYNTADATLWLFHALDRYVHYTADHTTLRLLLEPLLDIISRHIDGTLFGIGIDRSDGLLKQGEEGLQLTWMDAKVGDWVVTPRRGKAVEINALWYNALRLMEKWIDNERGDSATAQSLGGLADQVFTSFNRKFWYSEGRYLFDVVEGDNGNDPLCRPNQIFAISLPNPVLDKSHWRPVLDTVRERLLTPVGLRTLAPQNPDYKPKYFGDLRSRDAAYHQGTVWAWLIGPFIDAYLKVFPYDQAGARQLLEGFAAHLNDGCVGSVSEIFDAEEPHVPRGCIAQAWSVAELLRSIVKTEGS